MKPLITIGIVASVAIIFASYFFILNSNWPNKSCFNIDFSMIRQIVAEGGGALPLRVNCLTVARGALPSWGVAAGDFSGKYEIEFPSFQLMYPDKTAIIEAPFNKRLFDKFLYGTGFDQNAYETVQKAMLQADFIIPTHEHWDHIGGIAQSPNIDIILPKTILTKKQINGSTLIDSEFPTHALDNYKPREYARYCWVAPGVVLIDAPGHSSGHQLIYVKLQNGCELLFTGDIVWVTANLIKKKTRPWIANIKRKENRGQIAQQMKWLYNEFYAKQNNKLHFVTTHDPEQHKQYVKEGLLHYGFELRNSRNQI